MLTELLDCSFSSPSGPTPFSCSSISKVGSPLILSGFEGGCTEVEFDVRGGVLFAFDGICGD